MGYFVVSRKIYRMGGEGPPELEEAFLVQAESAEAVAAELCGCGLSRPSEVWEVKPFTGIALALGALNASAKAFLESHGYRPNKKKG